MHTSTLSQLSDNGQAADRINQDGIHILVNMNGYTKGARNEIFALKPAPIQVMWLGYPGTSGADYMDYIITDKITSPLHLADHYSEKLAFMPHTFFVGDHRYMFPHLLFKGQGTTNPEAIKSIDSQAGVVMINNVVQKPTHPVFKPQTPSQHSQQMQLQLVIQQQNLLQHSFLSLQHQAGLLQQQQQQQQQQGLHHINNSQFAVGLQNTQQQQQQLLQQLGRQQQQQQGSHGTPGTPHPSQLPSPSAPPPQQALSPMQQQQHPQHQQGGMAAAVKEAPLGLPTDLPFTSRSQYNLSENAVVFCNFNQLYKIDPPTLESWIRILKRIPNGVLWLLRFPAAGEANVLATAAKLGLPQGKIIFSNVATKEEHVRRGRLADLCLDTPICNGHTTGMDVLWAGTPVLTLPLNTLASRVAASQLHALGFKELVANSREEYEEKAVWLGTHPKE
jgi:protein O-GlcNAc transferase